MTTFADVDAAHRRWLSLDHDPALLRIAFAAVVANRLPGPPVWAILAGPSGAGKTASVVGLSGASECVSMSAFTPASFASAQTGTSFLDELNGRVAILTDFSTVLSGTKEQVVAVLSILRECFDGKYSRRTGKRAEPIEWRGKFGIIACSTPKATDEHIIGQDLGERFLVARTRVTDAARERIIDSAFDNFDRDAMSAELQEVSMLFLDELTTPDANIPSSFRGVIASISEVITRGRTGISRERMSHEINFSVSDQIEIPGRVVKQLKQLAIGLLAIGTSEDDTKKILYRIGRDSIPTNRLRVLELLSKGITVQSAIAASIGLSSAWASRTMDELQKLGLIDKNKKTNAWELTMRARSTFEG